MDGDNIPNVEQIFNMCNDLQLHDKNIRKKTLQKLQECIFNKERKDGELRKIFDQIYVHILKCVSDSAEICRELSIKIIGNFIIDLDTNDYYLTYILPVFEKRLGNVVLIEESEEIRLQLICLIHYIIEKYQDNLLIPFYDMLTSILVRTVQDPFPKVKSESCNCIIELTKALPRHFHLQADTLLKPVITLLGHQHFRTRVIAIKTISEIVENGGGKISEDAIVGLACAMNDPVPSVRLAVIRTGHAWMMRQPDRYSYFPKIIPLLLLGLSDEVAENVKETKKLWEEVGKQYEQENEKDLKDNLDYLSDTPEYYPSFIDKRPTLGCRMLVVRNTMRLLNAVSNELVDWRVEIRKMSSRLLVSVVLHNEGDITQHLQNLLPTMARATKDNDKEISSNVLKAAQLVGCFVKPSVYCEIILPALDGCSGPIKGQLHTLAALISTTPIKYLEPKLEEICASIGDRDILHTRENASELLNICEQIITVAKIKCEIIDYDLFRIIVTTMALTSEENAIKADFLLNQLFEVLELQDVGELYQRHASRLLQTLISSANGWTLVSTDRLIFETILLKNKSVFGDNLNIILTILQKAFHPEADIEGRIKILITVSTTLVDLGRLFDSFDEDFANKMGVLVMEVITPNLVWHAGRLREALRSAAVACLCAALPYCSTEVDAEHLLPILVSLSDERSTTTRNQVLRALSFVAKNNEGKFSSDLVNKIYPEILKRLDDGVDDVRINAIDALYNLWKALDLSSFHSHGTHVSQIDYIYSALLIQLDDQNNTYQEKIFELLKSIGHLNKQLLQEKLETARDKFRTTKYCDALLKYLA